MTLEEFVQAIVDEAHTSQYGTEVRQFVARMVKKAGVGNVKPGCDRKNGSEQP